MSKSTINKRPHPELKNPDSQVRNITLDIAKGLLILLMVIGHAGAPQWLVNCIYSFHMPCFFMISGILFSYAYLDKPKKFVIKRIKSIWWPFVKWTWIFLIFHNLFFNLGIYNEAYTLKEQLIKFIKIFFLLDLEQLLGGFWFLRALFIASIFCFLYYKFIGIGKKQLVVGVVALVTLSEILTIFNIKFLYFEPINFLACAYFMTGTLLNSFQFNKIRGRKFIITTAVLLIALSGFGEKIEMGNLTAYNLVVYFIESVIISTGVILILENYRYVRWNRYLVYLGQKTMDILILHFLAFRLVSYFKINLFGMDIGNMSQFPVIEEKNSIFWIIYVILGVIICLSYSKIKEYCYDWYLLWKKHKNPNIVL